MRLMRPGRRIVDPELCSCGDRPAKAANAFGVKSAMFGTSASMVAAVTGPMPGMVSIKAWLRSARAARG